MKTLEANRHTVTSTCPLYTPRKTESRLTRQHVCGPAPRHAGFMMVLAYSLTCPVGVAIGIGVADTYDPESTTAVATQVRDPTQRRLCALPHTHTHTTRWTHLFSGHVACSYLVSICSFYMVGTL